MPSVSQSTQPVSTKDVLVPRPPTSGTGGLVSSLLVAANPRRKSLAITNLSTNIVSFGDGAAAVLYSGISLMSGGVWLMDEYTFSHDAIYVIASGANSLISVQEFE